MVSSTIISPIKSLLIIFFEPFSLYIVYKAMVGPKYFGQDLINYMWHIGVIICSIFVHRCNSFPPFITFSRRYTVKYNKNILIFFPLVCKIISSLYVKEVYLFQKVAWIEPVVVQVFKCIFSVLWQFNISAYIISFICQLVTGKDFIKPSWHANIKINVYLTDKRREVV